MHRALLSFFAFVVLTTLLQASVEDDIRSLDTQRINALLHGDHAGLERLLADDLTYVHTDGKIDNKAGLLSALQDSKGTYHNYQGAQPTVRVQGDTALVNGAADLQTTVQNEPANLLFRYLAVYQKRHDSWQLVAYQSTQLALPSSRR